MSQQRIRRGRDANGRIRSWTEPFEAESPAALDVEREEHRWEKWARLIAPLIHDGLIDTPQERQIPDKAFFLARLLDEHLPPSGLTEQEDRG